MCSCNCRESTHKKLAWFIETPEFLFFSIIKKETGKFNVEYS